MNRARQDRRRHRPHGRRRTAGMTLIELMVSMAIGLFLTWGAFQVYLQSKSNYRAAEVNTRLNENARFALETLEPDLRLAGFWGRHRDAALLALPPPVTVSCDGANVSGWALDLATPVAATDDDYDLPCDPYSEAREGSDVLLVRHASELIRAPQAGQIQVQSSLIRAQFFDDGVVPAGFAADTETRDVVVNAYYVDNASSFDDNVPSLRRQTLVNGGVMEDQEMISGVENLQVQFGLDSNGDGSVDRYVDPDDPAAGTDTILAVRLWLLVRSEESPGAGYSDPRNYASPDADGAVIVAGEGPYPAGFQRLEVTKTVLLRNQVGG